MLTVFQTTSILLGKQNTEKIDEPVSFSEATFLEVKNEMRSTNLKKGNKQISTHASRIFFKSLVIYALKSRPGKLIFIYI